MSTTEAQKRANKKWRLNNAEKLKQIKKEWRDNNLEHHRATCRKLALEYWNNNKEKILEYKKQYYQYKKVAETFRNILIDDLVN